VVPVLSPCELAKSNAEQVAKIIRLLTELGCDIATPEDARQMFKLKEDLMCLTPFAILYTYGIIV
jgi:beta-keto acid cleavage enzyme